MRKPAGLILALAAALVLLAALQYRWIGQVSDADRGRLEASLRTSVRQFRQEFNHALEELCLPFLVRPRFARAGLEEIAARAEAALQQPGWLLSVQIWEEREQQLLQFDPQTRAFRPVTSDGRWSVFGRHWARAGARRPLLEALESFAFWLKLDEQEAVLIQRRSGTHLLILTLNREAIAGRYFPEMVRSHFPAHYSVAVFSGQQIVFVHGEQPSGSRIQPLRVDLLWQRGERVQAGRRWGGPAIWLAPGQTLQLAVWDPRGPLDSMVRRARRRNLAISGGVLLLLAGSMWLVSSSARRAQRLAAQQMQFVTGVTHELRTPLAVIASAADNMADGVVRSDEQVRRYGELLRHESRRLSAMVEQVLAFAAARAGRRTVEPRPTDAGAVIDQVLRDHRPAIETAGFQVERDVPPSLPPVKADEAALRQALGNLLDNALKYGTPANWLAVRAGASPQSVWIAVEDRGRGIDPEDRPHIFEPFYRSRAAREGQIRGTGIGLSLAQHAVEGMGGRITVDSSPGAGTRFVIHLERA